MRIASQITFYLFVLVMTFGVSGCGVGSRIRRGPDGTGKGWRVWIRTEPCSGRFDWLSVAKEQSGAGTGSGKDSYVPYESVLGNQGCTDAGSSGCTFAEANALMEKLRANPKFLDYCCHDYSVWENTETKAKKVVAGKYGTAGYGWNLVKSDLCCEEAEELAGIPGACSGNGGNGGQPQPKVGYIGCFKDPNNPYDLDGYIERSANNTPERCMATCRDKGFKYAGVQYGQSCLCGNSYGKFGPADNCNFPCTGDGTKTCGGYNANSVYATGAGGAEGQCQGGSYSLGTPTPSLWRLGTAGDGIRVPWSTPTGMHGAFIRIVHSGTNNELTSGSLPENENFCGLSWSFYPNAAGEYDVYLYESKDSSTPVAGPVRFVVTQ